MTADTPAPAPGRLPRLLLWAIIVAAGACSKNKGGSSGAGPSAPAPQHVSGTPHTDQVLDEFKSAGLTTEGFAALQPVPYGASTCERGRIQGVDTLICEYADDATLERGKKLVSEDWDREGVQTGVTTAAKRTLLAIVDRAHHDPNGKTINQILKAFKKL